MPYGMLPTFFKDLERQASSSSAALRLLILTATRSSEVLGANWSEFDLEEAIWTIPATRMKADKEHRVPLQRSALEILERLPRHAEEPCVFPGRIEGRSLSNMAMIQLMRKMGFGNGCDRGPYVPHGFRSSFRDWAGETSNHSHDVVEMALAHTITNKVEAAYRRGDLFLKRRKLMDDWDRFLRGHLEKISSIYDESISRSCR